METTPHTADSTNEFLTALVRHSADAVITRRFDGTVISSNPAAERILGYPEAELFGQPIVILVPESRRAEHEQIQSTLRAGLSVQNVETVRRRRDGSCVQVFLTAVPLGNSTGITDPDLRAFADGMVLELMSDVTGMRQLEQSLRRIEDANRELAGKLITAEQDERRRIARDLHDNLTQEVAGVSIEVGTLTASYADLEDLATRLKAIRQRLAGIATALRDASHRLHSTDFENLGFDMALEAMVTAFGRAEGITAQFESDLAAEKLNLTITTCLYRVAQECLQNISKHARASQIRVQLKREGSSVQLLVQDNGAGFNATQRATQVEGLGFVSMRERLRVVNGSVSIRSQPGFGTSVTASVPLVASVE